MKQFTLISLLACLTLPNVFAQFGSAEKLYANAVQLTLRMTQETQSNAVYLDDMLIGEFQQALQSIEESSISEAYAVSKTYRVQCFPTYNPYQIKALADESAEWLAALEAGKKPARGTAIRQIIDLYELEVEVQYNNGFAELYFHSGLPLNTIALSSEISKVQGVMFASTISPDGEGNDIEVKRLDTGALQLTYFVRFDCQPKGRCNESHSWVFEYQYGQVTFVGENGPEIPSDYHQGTMVIKD